jgi:cell division protein FtsL
VAGAQAARRQTARPLPEEDERRLRPVPGRRRRPSVVLHSRLATRLIVFGVCIALLAVGRVALTFAVVQKNLQTSAVIKQERTLRNDNMNLADQVAMQSANARVQKLAKQKYGLVPANDQRFLWVHAGAVSSGAPGP